MAKDISLQNCNLYITGSGLDSNGNKVVKLKFPNGPAFSIQTNGTLRNTHSLLSGKTTIKQIESLTIAELLQIEKEVVNYVKAHGSPTQKKKLRVYGS